MPGDAPAQQPAVRLVARARGKRDRTRMDSPHQRPAGGVGGRRRRHGPRGRHRPRGPPGTRSLRRPPHCGPPRRRGTGRSHSPRGRRQRLPGEPSLRQMRLDETCPHHRPVAELRADAGERAVRGRQVPPRACGEQPCLCAPGPDGTGGDAQAGDPRRRAPPGERAPEGRGPGARMPRARGPRTRALPENGASPGGSALPAGGAPGSATGRRPGSGRRDGSARSARGRARAAGRASTRPAPPGARQSGPARGSAAA